MGYVLERAGRRPKVLERWPDAAVVALPQGRALLRLPLEIWRAQGIPSQPILQESDTRAAAESDFEPRTIIAQSRLTPDLR